jgi:hypothetical protein
MNDISKEEILGTELPIELFKSDSRRSTVCKIPVVLSPLVTLLYFNLHLKLDFILY